MRVNPILRKSPTTTTTLSVVFCIHLFLLLILFPQLSDSSNDNDSYFTDPNAAPRTGFSASRQPDEQGHVRRSVLEEGTRPEYIIPVGSANGVWGMMRRVGHFRGEGWLALWKGTTNILAI
jgi:fusion and transport protein UGO1